MIIIHGDNQVLAQQKLSTIILDAKEKGLEIERVEGKDLSATSLSQLLTSSSLFSNNRLIVITDLLSLPQSANKKKLLQLIKESKQLENLILFENKSAHPATIKSLHPHKVHQFKKSPLIFKFLDSLRPNQPQQSLEILEQIENNREPLDMLFFMLARHVRQLIQAKTPGSLRLAPWQLKKLSRQSSFFSTDQLIDLHKQLYKIDKRQKLSQIKSLKIELKHLLLSL